MKSINGTFLDPKDTFGRKAAMEIPFDPFLIEDKSYQEHLAHTIRRHIGDYLVKTIPFSRWTLVHITEQWPEPPEMEYAKEPLSFHQPTVKIFIEYGTVWGEHWVMPQMDSLLVAPEQPDNSIKMRIARFIAKL